MEGVDAVLQEAEGVWAGDEFVGVFARGAEEDGAV